MDAIWIWVLDHLPQIMAATFVLVIIAGCGLAIIGEWWREQRDRAEQVERLRAIELRAAELRRQVQR